MNAGPIPRQNTSPARLYWLQFLILWAAGTLGVVAILPYSLTLQAAQLAQAELPVPLGALLVAQVGQNAVLVAAAVGLGLLLAGRAGLGAPLLRGALSGEKVGRELRAMVAPAVLPGAAGAIIIILLDILIFAPRMPETLAPEVSQPPAWQGLLGSFYGGITEELLLRLFFMSLLAWLIGLLWRAPTGGPAAGAFWSANLAAAVLFGLGHLPATAALVPLTPLVVLRAVVLNGLVGAICGHLYWKRGLEAAMLAHFSADIVLHVLLPLMSA